MRFRSSSGALALVAATILCGAFAYGSPPDSRPMLVGIADDAQVLGNPARAFPLLETLNVQVVRINLRWNLVAPTRPHDPSDPADSAYDWSPYDQAVTRAAASKIAVLLTIVGSPRWASGFAQPNHAPKRPGDLQAFAYAAATRYSGDFVGRSGDKLPAVRRWLAWNEPNNPVFLRPQYRRLRGRWVIQSARDYARICRAVYTGVHATKLADEQVACGGTDPNGNDLAASTRPSVSPLVFLRALKAAGLETFDVYAHNPYPARPTAAPSVRPGTSSVSLANVDRLLDELDALYGAKHLWLTEFAYQTNPPDRATGVSWSRQAAYLRQAYALARANPRVDMLVWFLLRDEPRLRGWQSGLLSANGRRKPAFGAFRALPQR